MNKKFRFKIEEAGLTTFLARSQGIQKIYTRCQRGGKNICQFEKNNNYTLMVESSNLVDLKNVFYHKHDFYVFQYKIVTYNLFDQKEIIQLHISKNEQNIRIFQVCN